MLAILASLHNFLHIFMGYWHWPTLGLILAKLANFLTFILFSCRHALIWNHFSDITFSFLNFSHDFHGKSTLTRSWTHFSNIGQFPELSYDFHGILLLICTKKPILAILASFHICLMIFIRYWHWVVPGSILAIFAIFRNLPMIFKEYRHWPAVIPIFAIFGQFENFPWHIDIDSHLDPF